MSRFDGGRMGPFVLGSVVRNTVLGDVRLALEDGVEHVVEIERFDVMDLVNDAEMEEGLVSDLASTTDFRHRHVAEVTGAGLDGGVPYIVRPYRMGRTLAELLAVGRGRFDASAVAAIAYSVAEALTYLAFEGSQPGAWSIGGFDEQDVFLGFDGSVLMTGTGLSRIRSPGRDPMRADFESLAQMVGRLDELAKSRVGAAFSEIDGIDALATHLRRRFRDDVGKGAAVLGSFLRRRFKEELRQERSVFGMATLH